MKFKKGDIVVCVDASGTSLIKRGEKYTVLGEGRPDNRTINIAGVGGMFERRFELAKEYLFDKLYLTLKQ